jgi:hypothetical protein
VIASPLATMSKSSGRGALNWQEHLRLALVAGSGSSVQDPGTDRAPESVLVAAQVQAQAVGAEELALPIPPLIRDSPRAFSITK